MYLRPLIFMLIACLTTNYVSAEVRTNGSGAFAVNEDDEIFVLKPGATKKISLLLEGDNLPDWLRYRFIEVRVSTGGNRTWLLPIMLIKSITRTALPDLTLYNVVLVDALKHRELSAAISEALKSKGIVDCDMAQPISDQIACSIYYNRNGDISPFSETSFSREDNRIEHRIQFSCPSPKESTQESLDNLGFAFREQYQGRYVREDAEATIACVQQVGMRLKNLLGKDSQGKEATLLCFFGGGLEQRQLLEKFVTTETSRRYFVRRGAIIDNAMLDRVRLESFRDIFEGMKGSRLSDEAVVSFVLQSGAHFTSTVGQLKRLSQEKNRESEIKTERTSSFDNQDSNKTNRETKGGLSIFEYVEIDAASNSGDESSSRRTATTIANDAKRDLDGLIEAIEGDLPLTALSIDQINSFIAATEERASITVGEFTSGCKTMDYRASLQTFVDGVNDFDEDVRQLRTKLEEATRQIDACTTHIEQLVTAQTALENALQVSHGKEAAIAEQLRAAHAERDTAITHLTNITNEVDARRIDEETHRRQVEEARRKRAEDGVRGGIDR